ncbi:MAG: tetratricopeptide repeat protein [Planctomycetaceae bacterium]|jgi:tetratricopeptide (TPR) repeat protein|nr:tetratricopeptide repeat protein [bacterium]MDB4679912.1 tetratricopeptide repeat protein [Planctomycetaceae bacterium]MDG2391381.1 tetratricopeptide repeat protein [Planctomycetaceae bacterium]
MSEDTNTPEELLKVAQKLFRKKQFESSIAVFQNVLSLESSHLKALRGLAAAHAQLGQIDPAIEQYQKLTQIDYSNGVAWLNLGALLNSQERYQEAAKAIRAGLLKEKKSVLGYLYLGEAHLGLNQNSMAMTAFKEAIKIDPDLLEANLYLGRIYLEMKSHAQAIRHFEHAAKTHPDSQEASQALREARQGKEDNRDAVNPFGRLVDMDNMGLKGNIVMNRELSQKEQLHDRQMIGNLSRDLLVETENCILGVKNEVEPALLTISRTLAEGGESPANLLSSIKKLQDAITSINQKRKEMRSKVTLIRGHEEIVNTPEFGGELGIPSSFLSNFDDGDDAQSVLDD